jgi:hypothetical protein
MILVQSMNNPIKNDLSWQLTLANWFLIGWIQALSSCINFNCNGNIGFWLGGLSGMVVFALVPLAIIYVANPKRDSMRIKLTYTISGWIVVLAILINNIIHHN